MFAVTVLFEVRPSMVEAFLLKMRENASTSLQTEEGCQRFDICQDVATPNRIFLYELYDSAAAFQAHLNSPHFASFEAAIGDMVTGKSVSTYSEVWT